jgi:hypothetical protein
MKFQFHSHMIQLPGKRYRVALIAILLTTGVVFSVLSFSPAAHAALHSTAQGERCQIILAKLQSGEQTSRVLSSQCVQGNQQLVAPQSSTLLMTWYKDIHYLGASTRIYGNSGPCDSSGYGIPNLAAWFSGWNDVISSFKVWNNCNWTRAYTNINYGGLCTRYYGNVPWVGSPMNDKISSFWVTSTRHNC